jgi:HlyD family secretion protein
MKKSLHFYAMILITLAVLSSSQCRHEPDSATTLTTSGMIEAIQTDIRALTTGELIELNVEEGQPIQKGDVLCRLDSEKLLTRLEQVQAGLAGARSKLRLVKKGTKKELIEMANNQLEAAEKEYETAKKNQERILRLYQEGAVSQAQQENADLALKAAQERFESARENHQLALRGREKEEIEMVEAEITSLEAQARLINQQIEDAIIIAPVSGTITTRYIELGELALPNTLLFSIIDISRTYVKAYIPEKFIGQVRLGHDVSVECDSFPERTFKGQIDYISDRAEFSPKNIQTKEERLKLVYMVKSYLRNDDSSLKPGMPVDVIIELTMETR